MSLAKVYKSVFNQMAKAYSGPLDEDFMKEFFGKVNAGIEFGVVSVVSDYLEDDKIRVFDIFFTDHSVMSLMADKSTQMLKIGCFDDSMEAMTYMMIWVTDNGGDPEKYVEVLESRILNVIVDTKVAH